VFEIGSSLRDARTRRRIDISQAEQATKIRGKYLLALEEEKFDLLPSQTYVKGFLRAYAEYLGLDGQLYVDEYNSRFVAGDTGDRRGARNVGDRRRERRRQTGVILITLALIAVLTTVVIGAWTTSGGGDSAKPAPPAHRTAPARHVPGTKHAPVAYLELTAVHGPAAVIVNRSAGGRTLFEGTLEKGETQAFNGRRFWLNVGAPENLVIRIGGRRIDVTGHRPWVLTVTPSGWHGHPA
jgi:hypothetical protein